MMDVALSILALIAGGITLELFACAGAAAAEEQAQPEIRAEFAEELYLSNPS
jgi:hypothetical protein